MQIDTHERINRTFCGDPVETGAGYSRVGFHATEQMAVDDMGLTHGGFVFGLADHAAMIAVNHPHVVLGAADVKFVKPVQTGDSIEAEARVVSAAGRKRVVDVQVKRNNETLFSGVFTCFILKKHVLDVD
jgi:uncharacterized protein (TIGR00369 family)